MIILKYKPSEAVKIYCSIGHTRIILPLFTLFSISKFKDFQFIKYTVSSLLQYFSKDCFDLCGARGVYLWSSWPLDTHATLVKRLGAPSTLPQSDLRCAYAVLVHNLQPIMKFLYSSNQNLVVRHTICICPTAHQMWTSYDVPIESWNHLADWIAIKVHRKVINSRLFIIFCRNSAQPSLVKIVSWYCTIITPLQCKLEEVRRVGNNIIRWSIHIPVSL